MYSWQISSKSIYACLFYMPIYFICCKNYLKLFNYKSYNRRTVMNLYKPVFVYRFSGSFVSQIAIAWSDSYPRMSVFKFKCNQEKVNVT